MSKHDRKEAERVARERALRGTELERVIRNWVANFERFVARGQVPGAETGMFAASPHDMFAALTFAIPDGDYGPVDGGWKVRFRDGHFVHAVHVGRGPCQRLTARAGA